MLWKLFYLLMRMTPTRLGQRTLWWALRKSGVAARLCDEGYWKLQLLGVTGEAYSLTPGKGGVNSLILSQRLDPPPEMSVCCDKFAVREFVANRVGREWLVPLLPQDGTFWTRPEDVDFDALPDRFVLKCNNGSQMNMIVRDKSKLDLAEVRAELAKWLKSDYSKGCREYQYAAVSNKIICEALIETKSGEAPNDYKIMCADGKPLYIWVDTGRFTNHLRTVYTPDWKRQDVTIAYAAGTEDLPRPKNLDTMLKIASALSKGIRIVRIDLYNEDGRIYFGEMTFTSDANIAITRPFSFSQAMLCQALGTVKSAGRT